MQAIPLVKRRWNSSGTAVEVAALTGDQEGASVMEDPPALQQCGGVAAKPSLGIVSES